MKLALIGGGGVRTPEFVRGVLVFAADLDLQELWLMDIDPARLELITPLCEEIVRQAGAPFRLFSTTSLDDALRGAEIIVTSLRVGLEQGRVLDERIALRLNVLGQETTGPGGFAMAMRSIPALLEIVARAEVSAPRAWIFNFTNPAGLVVQALHHAGFRRVVGICDSANLAQHAIARWLKLSPESVKTEVFGLNHLSWTRRAWIDGRNVLPELLQDQNFIHNTQLRFFGPEIVQRLGMFLNEYLFYYYFRDVAVERIRQEEQTRGEEVQALNRQLFDSLRDLPPKKALHTYEVYYRQREAGYMACAEADDSLHEQRVSLTNDTAAGLSSQPVGGYAGVALQTGLALLRDRPLRTGLNVPNESAITGLHPDDIVEVTCDVDGSGISPVFIGEIPEGPYLLVRSVKHYERLAAQAILERDRFLAVEALAVHPLIGSYALARKLLADYLEAHRAYVGNWS